jgi:hypothetical protein
MRADSPYRYHLLVGNKQLGPYDRRTIVGMRIKNLIDNNLQVKRSDGHDMTVAQLLADRFEMADAESLHKQATSPPASGIWPAFLIDCGGSLLKPGALGFIGRGELRFQGDHLRITANRKAGFVSTRTERVKLLLVSISAAAADSKHSNVIVLRVKPGFPGVPEGVSPVARIKLDDAHAVGELLELMNLKP